MDKTENEHSSKCSSCGETIDDSKKASITSWIFAENVCECVKPKRGPSKPIAPRPKRVLTFPGVASCSKCGMLRRRNREGSLTAWMMGPITCECGEIETIPRQEDIPASPNEFNGPPPDVLTNITIDQRYRISDNIGSGGMSVIYRAHDIKLGKQVALKFLLGHQLIDEQVARFQQEASVVARMNHPNIIRIYDFGVFNATPYMVLELVEGRTISDGLKKDGPFSIDEAVPVLEQICDGMMHAHKLGIVHRDLKADNVMLCGPDSEPVPLILDFGICKWEEAHLTHVGDQIGSPIYMSPEQRRGASVDSRTDIYSMGCLIFEMLTGRPLFTMDDFVNGNKPHLSVLERLPGENPAAIDSMILIIDRCLRTDPAHRFQTMSELRDALVNRSSKSTSVSTRPAAKGQTALRKPLGRRAALVLMVVSVLIASLGVAVHINGAKLSLESNKREAGNELDGLVAPLTAPLTEEALDNFTTPVPHATVEPQSATKVGSQGNKLPPRIRRPEVSTSTEGVVIFTRPTPEFVKNELRTMRASRLMLKLAPAGILTSLPEIPLERLNVSRSKLSKSDWRRIESTSSINSFDLFQEGGIGDVEFASILKMKGLISLGLCGDTISERGIAQLSQLPNLRILILEYNRKINDSFFAQLAKLHSLEQLWISHTGVGDKGVASLATLPGLRFIDLSYNQKLTDKALDAISRMPRLEEVRVVGCDNMTKRRITALSEVRRDLRIVTTVEGSSNISEIPKREWYFEGDVAVRDSDKFVQISDDKWAIRDPKKKNFLELRGKKVDKLVLWYVNRDVVKELERLPVMSLNIGDSNFNSDDYAQLAKMKNLRELSICSKRAFSDDDLRAIASASRLQKLSLKSTEPGSSINLEPFLRLNNLASLDLSDNINQTDSSVECISEFEKLKELSLANTSISSRALIPVSKLDALQTLDISGNENVRDEGLQYLFKARNLRLLRCRSCAGITPGGQRMLCSFLPKLEVSTAASNYSDDDMVDQRQTRILVREGIKESAYVIPKFLNEY